MRRFAMPLVLCLAAAPAQADTAADLYRRHEALEKTVAAKAAERLAGRVDAAAYQAHVVQTRFAQEALTGELKQLAVAGDAPAAHFLGVIRWDEGDILASSIAPLEADAKQRLQGRVDQSHREAMAWFEQAAKAGHAGAAWNLGRMNELGKGLPASRQAAAPWYFEAGVAWLEHGEREQAQRALQALEAIGSAFELAGRLKQRIEATPAR